jgi:hypothetical protein
MHPEARIFAPPGLIRREARVAGSRVLNFARAGGRVVRRGRAEEHHGIGPQETVGNGLGEKLERGIIAVAQGALPFRCGRLP